MCANTFTSYYNVDEINLRGKRTAIFKFLSKDRKEEINVEIFLLGNDVI